MDAMINGLNTNGYYQFPNGNIISKYIYVKKYTLATSGLTNILTTTCYVPPSDPLYPLLYPGWRGSFTDWNSGTTVLAKEILAIRGLFETLSPADITTLLGQGYVRTNWGIDLISDMYRPVQAGIFGGYLPADYAAGYPPRYILPISANTIQYSGGNISNSYGFPNQ